MNLNAFILFFKAEPFGLFGVPTPVKGYVNQRTGKLIAPYTGIRHQKLQKPDHPISDHLFAHALDEVASSHVQPEAAPKTLSAEFPKGQSGGGNGGGSGNGGSSEPPQEQGPFGPIFRQFRHDAPGAIAHLKQQQTGEAVAALHHPEVGDIDLVWGKEGDPKRNYKGGYGLAKIAAKHPEVIDDLQGVLLGLKKNQQQSGENRIRLESADGKSQSVVRLEWEGKNKTWLLTAYKKSGVGAGTRTDTTQLSGKDDTASLAADLKTTLPPPAPKGKLHKALTPLVRILFFKAA